MKIRDVLKILDQQEERLNENISLEDLDRFTDFFRNLDVENLEFSSKEELDRLSAKISSLINKVVFLKAEILKETDQLSKQKDAGTAYIKNEGLDNR